MVSILNTPILLHLVLLFIHRIRTQCVLMPTYSTKMVYLDYTYYILIKHTHNSQTTTMKWLQQCKDCGTATTVAMQQLWQCNDCNNATTTSIHWSLIYWPIWSINWLIVWFNNQSINLINWSIHQFNQSNDQ